MSQLWRLWLWEELKVKQVQLRISSPSGFLSFNDFYTLWKAITMLLSPSLGDGGKTNSPPEFSQAKFDMSSFVGGIILVLCVQAGGLLAMRFLKSKDQSSYDPMWVCTQRSVDTTVPPVGRLYQQHHVNCTLLTCFLHAQVWLLCTLKRSLRISPTHKNGI